MPKARSQKQFKFFKSVESGKIKIKGLSKREARLRTEGVKAKSLPKSKTKKRGKKK